MDNKPKRIIDATVDDLKQEIIQEFSHEFEELKHLLEKLKPKEQTHWLTRKQVSRKLGVSYVTLHNWNKTGKLIAYKLDGTVRYKLSDVNECLKKGDDGNKK